MVITQFAFGLYQFQYSIFVGNLFVAQVWPSCVSEKKNNFQIIIYLCGKRGNGDAYDPTKFYRNTSKCLHEDYNTRIIGGASHRTVYTFFFLNKGLTVYTFSFEHNLIFFEKKKYPNQLLYIQT